MAASAVAGLVIFTSVGTESPRTVKHGQTKTYRNHRAFVWGIPKTNGLVIGVWPGPQMEPWPNLRANMAASGFRLHRTTMTTMKRRGKRNPKKTHVQSVSVRCNIYVTDICDKEMWHTSVTDSDPYSLYHPILPACLKIVRCYQLKGDIGARFQRGLSAEQGVTVVWQIYGKKWLYQLLCSPLFFLQKKQMMTWVVLPFKIPWYRNLLDRISCFHRLLLHC